MRITGSVLRKIGPGCIALICIFAAFLYSDNVMVGYSDFAFLSGSNEVKNLSLEATWGDTYDFSVIITNNEDIAMDYKLWFVDAWTTNDAFAQPACLGQNETSTFWQYITWDTSLFTIQPHTSTTKNLSVTFPATYSGIYTGCVMFFPLLTPLNTSPEGSGGMAQDALTLPRRGGFIDALVHSSARPFIVKAFPSNRVYQATNNANRWILKFYNTNKQFVASSQIFELNAAGTGETLANVPYGTYYVFFKWQSHLASYLSWVELSWWSSNFFDFTTGTSLYNTQQLNNVTDDWRRYQTAWDLKPVAWDYDNIVNGNDVSIIVTTFPQAWVDSLEARNLNGDTEVNSSDIGIVGTNFLKDDPFIGWILFTWQ